MQITSIQDFKRALKAGPFAWPGGYPLYAICSDGAALCWDCFSAKELRALIAKSIHNKDATSGWQVLGIELNIEDTDLICAHCNNQIESAYGD